MKSITIGFSSSTASFAPFSAGIKAVLGTPYSHTYLRYFSEEFGQQMVFQASGLAVNLVSYEQFLTKERVYEEFTFPVEDCKFKELVQYFCVGLGQPYSVLQIINTLCFILFRIKPFNKEITGWDCSKLMEKMLSILDFKLPYDPDVVTPKDVYEYLNARFS